MASRPSPVEIEAPAVKRLSGLAPLGPEDVAVILAAAGSARSAGPRRDVTAVFRAVDTVLILEGWAHRSYLLADGRRQIVELLVPGDVVVTDDLADGCDLAVTTITATTYCALPKDGIAAQPALARALQLARSLDGRRLRRQILRLGRMDALERVTDWLLELYERLSASGLAAGEVMPLPMTQETIADALGLTNVHVNRTLSLLRRENLISVQAGRVTFLDRRRCRSIVEPQ